MTIPTQTQNPTLNPQEGQFSQGTQQTQPAPGFQTIPTRIRDVRATQGVPPLVVEPNSQGAEVEGALAELGGRMSEIHRTAAEAYLSQNNYEKALPHLEAAVMFATGEADYLQQLGFVRYITGDDVGAINAFNSILAGDNTNGEAWFNLGMVLFGQEQFAEAEMCFQKSIESDPSDAQTWNNRGVCLFKIDRADDARACFQRALQIDPNDEDAQFNATNMV